MSKLFTFNYYRPYELGLKWVLRHGRLMMICFILLVPLTYFVYRMVEKSRLPEISHDDTILTIDWNSGISLEENDLRVYRLLAQVDSLILQSTSMSAVQQFLMSLTREITPSESVIYMKAKEPESWCRWNGSFQITWPRIIRKHGLHFRFQVIYST